MILVVAYVRFDQRRCTPLARTRGQAQMCHLPENNCLLPIAMPCLPVDCRPRPRVLCVSQLSFFFAFLDDMWAAIGSRLHTASTSMLKGSGPPDSQSPVLGRHPDPQCELQLRSSDEGHAKLVVWRREPLSDWWSVKRAGWRGSMTTRRRR